MGTILKSIKFEQIKKCYVVGKSISVPINVSLDDNIIEKHISAVKKDIEKLRLIIEYIKEYYYVGWMGDYFPDKDNYTYMFGLISYTKPTINELYEYREINETTMAIANLLETENDNGLDIHRDASEIVKNSMNENNYEYDFSKGFYEIELYNNNEMNKELVFMTPCKVK